MPSAAALVNTTQQLPRWQTLYISVELQYRRVDTEIITLDDAVADGD
jgi:hypothetical protein